LSAKIVKQKVARGLTWKGIAKKLGDASPIVYTAALLGQMALTTQKAAKVAGFLGLSKDEA